MSNQQPLGVLVDDSGASDVPAEADLDPTNTSPQWTTRARAVAAVVVLGVYLVLSAFNGDEVGYLSTDTGGKVATLEAMDARGDFVPDIGYWAEEFDPDGEVHPFWFTSRVDDKWVNVTTMPMLLAAKPLYSLGGLQLAMLLPMLGALIAAFGARALAVRVDPTRAHVGVFWVAALASPLVVYALDFWEHTWGTALCVWGVVWMNDLVAAAGSSDGSPRIDWRPLAVGAAVGLAATMRTEAMVFGFVMVAVGCMHVLLQRRPATAVGSGLLAGVGFFAMQAVVGMLEQATIGQLFRAGRATDAATAGGADIGLRIEESLVTAFALFPNAEPAELLLGAVVMVVLVAATHRAHTGGVDERVLVLVGLAAVLFLLRFLTGLGFVPGLVATTPFAAVAFAIGWSTNRARFPLLVAGCAVPLVWVFQYTGGAIPQWGGRYLQPAALMLLAVGMAVAASLDRRLQVAFVALSVAVSVFGVGWLQQRSTSLERAFTELADRSEPGLLFEPAFLAREAGPVMLGEQWLTGATEAQRTRAAEVFEAAAIEQFGLVQWGIEPDIEVALADAGPIGSFSPTAISAVELFADVPIYVVTYDFAG